MTGSPNDRISEFELEKLDLTLIQEELAKIRTEASIKIPGAAAIWFGLVIAIFGAYNNRAINFEAFVIGLGIASLAVGIPAYKMAISLNRKAKETRDKLEHKIKSMKEKYGVTAPQHQIRETNQVYGRMSDHEQTKKLSDRLAGFVNIVFAVVIGTSIANAFGNNFSKISELIPTISIIIAWAAVIMSWVGYHQLMENYPYRLIKWGYLRFASDVGIVFVYAVLIFGWQNLNVFLGMFPIIYSLYAFQGIARDKQLNQNVSWHVGSLIFAGYFAAVWGFRYSCDVTLLCWQVIPNLYIDSISVGVVALLLALYRIKRERRGYPQAVSPDTDHKLRIAVDIDGVLGEQVPPVLAKLNEKLGLRLTKEDVTKWDLAIKDTRIDIEIENALLEPQYVLNMEPVIGAKESLKQLYEKHFVIIATSRPKETESHTLEWLNRYFNHHDFINVRQTGKANVNADILIDDNPKNITEFTVNDRIGILFSQPWNKQHPELDQLIENGRVIVCNGWSEVIRVIRIIERSRSIGR